MHNTADGSAPVHWFRLDIDNSYEDEVVRTTATIYAPEMPSGSAELAEWEENHVRPATGTGRAEGKSGYVVTVADSSDIAAVGHVWEWF